MHSKIFISSKGFINNIKIAQSILKEDTKLCVTLKGDAYGHGLEELVDLAVNTNVDYIGLSTNQEIKIANESIIKNNKEDLKLIRLRATFYEEVEELLAKGIECEELVGSWEKAILLDELGKRYNKKIAVHINLDSGMGRSAFYFDDTKNRKELFDLEKLSGIKVVGLMTHFPGAEDKNLSPVMKSFENFKNAVCYLKKESKIYRNALVHCASSSLALRESKTHCDMVRFGDLIYGSRLSNYVPVLKGIKPIMSWKTKVSEVFTLKQGSTLGYSLHKIRKDIRVAALPIGYGDGYPKKLSNKGYVLIRGEKHPIIGDVCLNTITVKVSDNVRRGDEVVLLGWQKDRIIRAEELSKLFNSIHTEIQMAGFFNQKIIVDSCVDKKVNMAELNIL